MKDLPKAVTTGDLLHTYGSVGYLNYTCRRRIRMDAPVDPALLEEAVRAASARYPYLCVRLRFGKQGFFWEKNDAPIAVIHTSGAIRLASGQSNHHIWAVCWEDDTIYLDFFHGYMDGMGATPLTETLLYYYLNAQYGDVDSAGIRTLDTPVSPAEYTDPLDALPEVPLPENTPATAPAYSVVRDGGLTLGEGVVTDLIIPESSFLPFTSASDASPGTMVSLLLAKAMDAADPARAKPIVSAYAMNARPMLHAPEGHHNCVSSVYLRYTDRVRALPFETQCTAYRGMTFVQSEEDSVRQRMVGMSSLTRSLARIPDISARRAAFFKIIASGAVNSCTVSYTGQWKRPSLAKHIRELWTHVSSGGGMPLIEVKSISGNLFLSLHRSTREDVVDRAFLRQLEEHGIPYTVARFAPCDNAAFPGPEELG